ncbi:hypothetical protein L1049_012078 [Liquidambar formosana]|uniref:F-box domain-containing protein n=1 Tax=Liquidambar formosana TaxID=63359 RepID=A0AAP0WXG2_LIQFO
MKFSTKPMDLPADLIADIVSRLPAKSVVRFRCVSKLWRTVIADPSLIRAHLNREIIRKNPNRLLLMYSEDPPSVTYEYGYSVRFALTSPEELINLDPAFRYSESVNLESPFPLFKLMNFSHPLTRTWFNDLKLVGSCNGVVCLSVLFFFGQLSMHPLSNPHTNIYLWNPSIMECRTLPFASHDYKKFRLVYIAFGFDALNEDYKVVKIVYIYDVEAYEVEVYSLKRDSWKKIGNGSASLQCQYMYYSNQVVVNGSPHWIVNSGGEKKWPPFIVSFDMADEVFCEMSLPDSSMFFGHTCVGLVEGWLSVVSYLASWKCEVWVMKEYGVVQSWTRQYVIAEKSVIYSLDRPLGLLDSGELLLGKWNGGLMLYDPKSTRVEKFGTSMGPFLCQVATYMESLVSVMPVKQPSWMDGKHHVKQGTKRMKITAF